MYEDKVINMNAPLGRIEEKNRYFQMIEDCHNLISQIETKTAFISNPIPVNEVVKDVHSELESRLYSLRERLLYLKDMIVE